MIQRQRTAAATGVEDSTSDADDGLRRRYVRPWSSLLLNAAVATLTCCAPTAVLVSASLLTLAAAAQPHQVLMLSDTGSAPAETVLAAHVRASFTTAAVSVQVFAESLDNAGFPLLEHQSAVADLLRVKYAERDLDAVLALGPSSLRFLADRRDTLFANVPIVYAAVRPSSVPAALRDATGIISLFNLIGTVDLALELQPDARHLVVVTGAGPIDVSLNETARVRLEPYRDRIEISYLEGLTKARTLEQLRSLSRDTIVVFLALRVDGVGDLYVDQPGVARELAAASAAPLYVVTDTYLVDGVVGGDVESFPAIGDQMAALTLRILAGERAADLPPLISTTLLSVNWPALRRWDLDERRLPPGTTVSFRGPSLWAQHRLQILAVTSILILQTLLIVALLLYIRKRRVERTLRQTEDRYQHVVDAQSDLVCRYLPDTTLTFVSDAYCRYFGCKREELIGRRFVELLPESERGSMLEQVRSLIDKVVTVSYIHKAMMADGSVRWQQWINHPVVDGSGKVVELQGIGRDITELKAAETEAQQRREQVTHLTRVAILGELSGALAHELNQPMTAILSNAQTADRLLRQPSPDLAELREIVKDIVADDVRAGEVIRRLRTMLKPGATAFQLVDVPLLLAEVLVLVHAQLVERNVVLIQRFPEHLPRVYGDRIQLQQVLLNLLMNACEAMRDNAPHDRTLLVEASDDSSFVTVSVTDCGSGLAPDVAERLFEAFFTTKADGLGLGLSICRSIVTLHNGQISVKNNADRGATVDLVLPVAQVEPQALPKAGGSMRDEQPLEAPVRHVRRAR